MQEAYTKLGYLIPSYGPAFRYEVPDLLRIVKVISIGYGLRDYPAMTHLLTLTITRLYLVKAGTPSSVTLRIR